MFTLKEWFEITKKGTSGDQVMSILYTWKNDRDALLEQIKKLTDQLKNF